MTGDKGTDGKSCTVTPCGWEEMHAIMNSQ